jgi:hypothetical protein
MKVWILLAGEAQQGYDEPISVHESYAGAAIALEVFKRRSGKSWELKNDGDWWSGAWNFLTIRGYEVIAPSGRNS